LFGEHRLAKATLPCVMMVGESDVCWLLTLREAVSLVLVLCYVIVKSVTKTITVFNCVLVSVCSQFSVNWMVALS